LADRRRDRKQILASDDQNDIGTSLERLKTNMQGLDGAKRNHLEEIAEEDARELDQFEDEDDDEETNKLPIGSVLEPSQNISQVMD